jgi:hypothetical protein
MTGQNEHTLSATLAREKIFVAVQDDRLLDIWLGEFWQASEFGGHPAEVAEHSANDRLALRVTPIRKRYAQVDFRGLSQSWQEAVKEFHEANCECPGHRSRQQA